MKLDFNYLKWNSLTYSNSRIGVIKWTYIPVKSVVTILYKNKIFVNKKINIVIFWFKLLLEHPTQFGQVAFHSIIK